MYQNTDVFVDQEFEHRVRVEAYHLWEAEGHPQGKEKDFWFLALNKLLTARAADSEVARTNEKLDHSFETVANDTLPITPKSPD